MIKPLRLRKGDKIGIMALSDPGNRRQIDRAESILRARGFDVFVHPQTFEKQDFSPGSVYKTKVLHDLFRDPDIRAVFAACGGAGIKDLLHRVDYRLIRDNPKILIGFSDTTMLLNAIQMKTGLVTFHGPPAEKIAETSGYLRQCFNLLGGKNTAPGLSRAHVLRPGHAHGPLIGGNLTRLTEKVFEPFMPRLKGSILFLEDVEETPHEIAAKLRVLHRQGAFHDISGLILGSFWRFHPWQTNGEEYRIVRDNVLSMAGSCHIPVIAGAPFGHGKDLCTLPIGLAATLTARKGKSALALDGPAVTG